MKLFGFIHLARRCRNTAVLPQTSPHFSDAQRQEIRSIGVSTLLAGLLRRNTSERTWVWPRHFGTSGGALVLATVLRGLAAPHQGREPPSEVVRRAPRRWHG